LRISELVGLLALLKLKRHWWPCGKLAGGSTWLAKTRDVKEDATAVKRLRECGAVMVGKTNMHELGMGTSGVNPHYGYSHVSYI